MTREEAIKLHQFIDTLIEADAPAPEEPGEPTRELPEGKRAVRTKSTGDRVYLIDEIAKTKAWITSPEILGKLGFELSDVDDVDDASLLGYSMTASVYRVEE